MKRSIGEKSVNDLLEDWQWKWSDFTPARGGELAAFGYEFNIELGRIWSDAGFTEGDDFLLAESVGTAASVTITMLSKRIVCHRIIDVCRLFLEAHPRILIILIGEIEGDDDADSDLFFKIGFSAMEIAIVGYPDSTANEVLSMLSLAG